MTESNETKNNDLAFNSDTGRNRDRESEFSQKDSKHKHVRKKSDFIDCKYDLPHYGSVMDTGTVNTFIKVLYINETAKKQALVNESQPDPSTIDDFQANFKDETSSNQMLVDEKSF